MKNFYVKNIIPSLILVTAFSACDKIPDGVVDVKTADYQIANITAPSNFSTSSADSTIITSVQILFNSSVSKVWCSIKSLDQTSPVSPGIEMLDNGNLQTNGDQTQNDGIYSCKFVMSKKLPNGKYQIEYFVEDNIRNAPDNLVKVGAQIFNYDNGQVNYPPAISNLVIPNSVNRGESFIFTIKADDANGPLDIAQVYFKLIRPDGTTTTPGAPDDNGSGAFLMHDDGSANYGDAKSDDGVYSFKNSFGASSQTGAWRFEFEAKDRRGALSNTITFNLTVN